MVELDGSSGEGGGQILRSALTLSLLTGKPFHVSRIRANRSRPGLAAQHLACVNAAATIGRAKLHGATLRSSDLEFTPGEVRAGDYSFPIGTAGATALVAQTVALPLAHATGESTVTIDGGTHVAHAPCFDYLAVTWAPVLGRVGYDLRLTMDRPGFYPRGGGRIRLQVSGNARPVGIRMVAPVDVQTATVLNVVAGNLPDHVADRQGGRIGDRLRELGVVTKFVTERWANGPSSFVAVTCADGPEPTLCFALGEKGKPAETVADEAFADFAAWAAAGWPVDPHLADQLLLPLVLAEGASEFRTTAVTQHLLTNVETVGHFLDRQITIEGELGAPGIVRVAGRGV
jgi:RNA 3'-phosphate cyclase